MHTPIQIMNWWFHTIQSYWLQLAHSIHVPIWRVRTATPAPLVAIAVFPHLVTIHFARLASNIALPLLTVMLAVPFHSGGWVFVQQSTPIGKLASTLLEKVMAISNRTSASKGAVSRVGWAVRPTPIGSVVTWKVVLACTSRRWFRVRKIAILAIRTVAI